MNEENREKLRGIADLSKEEIGRSEEDVKIIFIVPLFEAFGHERLKFEHRWKDAIVEKFDQSCEIVIETKNYDKDLDADIQQLKMYCDEERPLLGIIANGTQIRIFSPFWRGRKFGETLIYYINREDLKHESIIQTLENILSRNNLESGKVNEFIIEREREIENAEKKIKGIERESEEKKEQIQAKIGELSDNVNKLKKQIEESESEKRRITTETREQLSQIWQNLGFLHPPVVEKAKEKLKEKGVEEGTKEYIIRYRKMLENLQTLPSRMKKYIDEEERVTFKDLKHTCVEKFGCKSETSGSIFASIKVLEIDGYIKIEGRGDNKRIVSTKKEEEGNVFTMDKGDNT